MNEYMDNITNNLIVLDGFVPASFGVCLLKKLGEQGFDNPVLYGGALRDQILEIEINDYDIVASMGNTRGVKGEVLVARAIDRLQKIPGVSEIELNYIEGDWPWCRNSVNCTYQGKPVTLNLGDEVLPFKEKIIGDAPINTIAMDSSGLVLAHRLFPDHAQQRIYAPFTLPPAKGVIWSERADTRYEHLRKKIHGLSYRPMHRSSFEGRAGNDPALG